MDPTAEQVDVVVVGAGWNGLISAKTYLDLDPSANLVIIDEQASIGGVWSAEKLYPNLYAQIKHGLFEYSFYPMRHEGISEDEYISGETIHNYLNDFAWDFDLVRRTRLRTKVTNVSRRSVGGWRLELAGKTAIECGKLIYASGATSSPVIPEWPRNNFNSPIIHSCETGAHLEDFKNIKSATVVGGAKSSYDTVFLLLKSGIKVDWIIREDGSGPLAIVPPTIFGIVHTIDIVGSRFCALFGASIMSTDGAGHQFLQRTFIGRFIAWLFWLFVNWVSDRYAGYSKSENAKKLRPTPIGNGIYWANSGLGAASTPNFWRVFHAGDCTVHRTDIESLSNGNMVNLKNGDKFQTDYIILSTGFDKSFQVFSTELQQECGFLPNPAEAEKWAKLDADAVTTVDDLLPGLRSSPFKAKEFKCEETAGGRKLLHGPSLHYRRLIVPALAAQGDRSIFFPGFIHTIYTPLVAEVQALWGVAFMLGLYDPPVQDEMEQEIAEWNVWSRKRYVAQGRKHAYAIYDFLPYIDVLLRDLDINTRRKKNWFKNMFLPVAPRDYNGLVDELRQAVAKRQEPETPASGSMTPVSVRSVSTEASFANGLSKDPAGDHGHSNVVKLLGFN